MKAMLIVAFWLGNGTTSQQVPILYPIEECETEAARLKETDGHILATCVRVPEYTDTSYPYR